MRCSSGSQEYRLLLCFSLMIYDVLNAAVCRNVLRSSSGAVPKAPRLLSQAYRTDAQRRADPSSKPAWGLQGLSPVCHLLRLLALLWPLGCAPEPRAALGHVRICSALAVKFPICIPSQKRNFTKENSKQPTLKTNQKKHPTQLHANPRKIKYITTAHVAVRKQNLFPDDELYFARNRCSSLYLFSA